MQIRVTKLTSIELAHAAIRFTSRVENPKAALSALYRWEHSPMRTQLFWIEMIGIPTKVSVHLVRHSAVGQLHFVKSNREDRGGAGDEEVNRLTPVDHAMLLNAQHLVDISRKRLCTMAEETTRRVWCQVRDAVSWVDPDLAKAMVPNGVYRGGVCSEPKSCGLCTREMRK